MAEIIFSALFTAVLLGFCLTGVLAFTNEFKENKTLLGRCMFVSCVSGIVLISGLFIWLIWAVALA